MSDKFSFKPFILYDQPTNEALYRINAIMALHTGYKASGLPKHKFAIEFYDGVGEIFAGSRLKDLELDHLDILGDVG